MEEKIKSGVDSSCLLMCGQDETLIKEYANRVIDKCLDDNFRELNLVKFDGNSMTFDGLMNACETLPFMSDKKVVVVQRAKFLRDDSDSAAAEVYKKFEKYADQIPSSCMLVMYYVFDSKREKPSKKLAKLDKKVMVAKIDKMKGVALEGKVKSLFDDRGRDIGKVELRLLCSLLDNNMGIIENEVEKLIMYTHGREITKKDIADLFPKASDDDVFDMVDFLSQKRVEKAIESMNELVFKGEKIPYVLYMIERQFKILFGIKLGMEKKKDKNTLVRELGLHPYVCEKLMTLSKKFTLAQIERAIELCLDSEEKMKSTSLDQITEMELLMISIVMA